MTKTLLWILAIITFPVWLFLGFIAFLVLLGISPVVVPLGMILWFVWFMYKEVKKNGK